MGARLDQLLDPAYPGELAERSMEDLRAMRAECQEVESGLSLLRRVVQGRLDIVGVELGRRASGGDPADLPELIAQLPQALADRQRGPGQGRLTAVDVDVTVPPALEAELEAIAPADTYGDLTCCTDDELRELTERLSAFERTVSDQRRLLFSRIDALQAEIVRRYRDGEASVDALLG